LAHSGPSVQFWPCFLRQAAVELQVVTPVQVSASSAPVTKEQVPGFAAAAQVWHAPLHIVVQQTLSTHRPEPHSAAAEQTLPGDLVATQVVPAQ
jgi:hypothetical protein